MELTVYGKLNLNLKFCTEKGIKGTLRFERNLESLYVTSFRMFLPLLLIEIFFQYVENPRINTCS